MSLPSPREATVDWARRALVDELRDDPTLSTRAENLVAIAEHFNIPIEALVKWIHTPAQGKRWTAAEWRRWCERYRETAHELELKIFGSGELCSKCHGAPVEVIDGCWQCPACGAVWL